MRVVRTGTLDGLVPSYEALGYSYEPVGLTTGPAPAGFDRLCRRVRIGTGAAAFERAANDLLGWEMHRRVGLRVAARGSVEPGRTVVLGLGIGLLLVIPCRVVSALDEPYRVGFTYGTLPGHPESGEESFHLTLDATGAVHFEVRAYSCPGHPLIRATYPLARAAQRIATGRYIRAMARIASGP